MIGSVYFSVPDSAFHVAVTCAIVFNVLYVCAVRSLAVEKVPRYSFRFCRWGSSHSFRDEHCPHGRAPASPRTPRCCSCPSPRAIPGRAAARCCCCTPGTRRPGCSPRTQTRCLARRAASTSSRDRCLHLRTNTEQRFEAAVFREP